MGFSKKSLINAFSQLFVGVHQIIFPSLGLEAYFFYRALVTVFDTSRLSTILHYTVRENNLTLSFSKVGYAVPFVIVMTTLIVGIATTDEAYILVQEGEVGPFLLARTNLELYLLMINSIHDE